jgi:hypothetical protein
MKLFIHSNGMQLLTYLGPISVLVAIFAFLSVSICPGAEPATTSGPQYDDDGSDDWMFDNSLYTNDPKTGNRVDQFKHEKTPYRDPNAFFDSPLGSFLFGDSWGSFYENYNPFAYFSALSEFMGNYFFGNDSDKYYPYDGDPNDEENLDQAM